MIDDNSNKWGRLIEGIPIVGGRYDIMDMVVKYRVDRIIYAFPPPQEEPERDPESL